MTDKIHYDLIIIGAGPAGMTAGVYAARKQIDTIIITNDIGGQTVWSSGIENYLGYIYISGTELVKKFEDHLRTFDIRLEFANVVRLAKEDNDYAAFTEDGRRFISKAVIIGAGKSPRMLNVPGEKEFQGRGVTYCATCDGPLFAGQPVAIVGGGNSGLDAAVQLMKICPKVYVIEMLPYLKADEVMVRQVREANNVEILVNTSVQRVFGDDLVGGITVRDNLSGEQRDLSVNGVFVEVGLSPNTDFVRDLAPVNDYGEIIIDCGGRTGIPGLFAAGDVTNVPEKQIIIAAGDGSKAALAAYSYLVRHPSTEDWGPGKGQP